MGSESWEVGNGRWQADDIWHIERVSFAAVEGSDHHVHIGAPDQWLEQITAFAASLGP